MVHLLHGCPVALASSRDSRSLLVHLLLLLLPVLLLLLLLDLHRHQSVLQGGWRAVRATMMRARGCHMGWGRLLLLLHARRLRASHVLHGGW